MLQNLLKALLGRAFGRSALKRGGWCGGGELASSTVPLLLVCAFVFRDVCTHG
jgi:hypothetical protein